MSAIVTQHPIESTPVLYHRLPLIVGGLLALLALIDGYWPVAGLILLLSYALAERIASAEQQTNAPTLHTRPAAMDGGVIKGRPLQTPTNTPPTAHPVRDGG